MVDARCCSRVRLAVRITVAPPAPGPGSSNRYRPSRATSPGATARVPVLDSVPHLRGRRRPTDAARAGEAPAAALVRPSSGAAAGTCLGGVHPTTLVDVFPGEVVHPAISAATTAGRPHRGRPSWTTATCCALLSCTTAPAHRWIRPTPGPLRERRNRAWSGMRAATSRSGLGAGRRWETAHCLRRDPAAATRPPPPPAAAAAAAARPPAAAEVDHDAQHQHADKSAQHAVRAVLPIMINGEIARLSAARDLSGRSGAGTRRGCGRTRRGGAPGPFAADRVGEAALQDGVEVTVRRLSSTVPSTVSIWPR